MIYTSGTEGRPKGVTYSRGALEDGVHKYLARLPMTADDVALIAAPITRPMALRTQLLPLLYAGGSVSLLPSFKVDTYVAALTHGSAKTILALLPSALQAVLNHPRIDQCNFAGVRSVIVGGDHVAKELHERAKQILGIELTEQYGSSETGPITLNPPFGRKKPGSAGLPMYGVAVCVVNDAGHHLPNGVSGNIVVQSEYAMSDYWNDTALTRKTIKRGFVQTGDLGKFDEDGYLWVNGRKKDVIIRGGSNISPGEVEFALRRHVAVQDASVVGVAHEDLGQEVRAFVTVKESVVEQDLLDFARGQLAEYMVPARIYIVDSLPLKGAGKIDRSRLRLRAETGCMDL